MRRSTLILGLGNSLLADEAVGGEVIRRLQAQPVLPDTVCIDGGTLSFTLAVAIAAATRLIVVDAAIMGSVPGCIRVFEGAAMDRQLRGKGRSVHEVGLAELLDMARLSDTLPYRRALVGIEPALVDWGEHLTPPVATAVPAAIATVRELIARWDTES